MHRLLVSVMDEEEATEAASGGALILDGEDPASALGMVTAGTLAEICAVGVRTGLAVSTNVGEAQSTPASASLRAAGAAAAGTSIIKVGLAGVPNSDLANVIRAVVIGLRRCSFDASVVPALFVDDCGPSAIRPAVEAAASWGSSGFLIDTLLKTDGRGLFDWLSEDAVTEFAKQCHGEGLEAWVAGGLDAESLPRVWDANVDVACVRAAACLPSEVPRAGKVTSDLVARLVASIP